MFASLSCEQELVQLHPNSIVCLFIYEQQLVEHLLASGIDGFYVAGSTGEGFAMDFEERVALTTEVTNPSPNIGPASSIGLHSS